MGNSRRRKQRQIIKDLFTYDTNLIVAVVFLTIFGLVMIYSASYYKASMSESFGNDPAYFLKNQLQWTVVGLVVMFIVANFNYHWLKPLAPIGFLGSLLLIFLLTTSLGVSANGATRWLQIPGLGQFQVAEPIKVAMILFSATMITGTVGAIQHPKFTQSLKGMCIVLLPVLVVFVLIYKISNNMSTALIVLGITCLMIFLAHPKYWPFVLVIVAGGAAIGLYIYFLKQNPGDSTDGFRSARILAWLDPYSYESDKAYQALQALYAIGSGGLFGKGLGNSIQKLGRIPEPYNDMIFAIVCEELGVFGAGLVILMFIYLLYRLYCITQQAEDLFGRMLAIGVFGHVALQVILNLMVVTSLFPTTGVTLPFFSAGGTATVFLFVEFGIVLNVEKYARRKREQQIAKMEQRED